MARFETAAGCGARASNVEVGVWCCNGKETEQGSYTSGLPCGGGCLAQQSRASKEIGKKQTRVCGSVMRLLVVGWPNFVLESPLWGYFRVRSLAGPRTERSYGRLCRV